MKTTVHIAASPDGFIAKPDGSIDWLGDSQEEDIGTKRILKRYTAGLAPPPASSCQRTD